MKNLFNGIKDFLLSFAQSRGMPSAEVIDGWDIDYRSDLDEILMQDLCHVNELMRVCYEAMDCGDLLTARCALLRVRVFSQGISSFFDAIEQDVQRVIDDDFNKTGDKLLDWPTFPDKYEFPEKYKYKNKIFT